MNEILIPLLFDKEAFDDNMLTEKNYLSGLGEFYIATPRLAQLLLVILLTLRDVLAMMTFILFEMR